jgi:hypothetical protein
MLKKRCRLLPLIFYEILDKGTKFVNQDKQITISADTFGVFKDLAIGMNYQSSISVLTLM